MVEIFILDKLISSGITQECVHCKSYSKLLWLYKHKKKATLG